MKKASATQPNTALRSAQSAVLLIFFMPANLNTHPHRALLTALAESIQAQFGSHLRVLQIDEVENPDVMSSFGITETPTFVLVKQGVELWRQVGICTEKVLVSLIRQHLTDNK
ncbi:thioredoxin family protein [Fibrivirga algicola]|uniref:Thioredoxin family protein n=1 Tax=Fibrivirga algicola TaxID=2950420 RepID=A0ABX0QNW6_9BACT|nr:thioredoxin family protein [Fibrivirga algicola]NID13478.1 thioredoxin family protein [Fibrivirga algicola]